ncbi:unnamed protein product [Withania somnifera]
MEAAGSISKNYGRSLKKSIHRTFSSTPCENLAPMNYQNGILQTPPILYHSFPPFLAHQKQPPLLPLPISKSSGHQYYKNHIYTLCQNRTTSLPPTNRKVNKNVKTTKPSPKKNQESPKSSNFVLSETSDERKSSKVAMVASTNPLGPDPKDLPKDVSMVLSMSSTTGALSKNDANMNQLSLLHMTSENIQAQNSMKDDANGNLLHINNTVVFTTVSPPPSSLPLPTFSLRPKLSCNVEASAGVDAGATDNLRRLLRLR